MISKEGYHGTHGSLQVYQRNRQVEVKYLEEVSEEYLSSLGKGDLVLLETPQNPRGEVADLQYYTSKLSKDVILAADATFAPPPIQNLLSHGAHIVMHSSTKYFGGHSDLLGGVLMTRNQETHKKLLSDRLFLGSVMGNMETWLLLRSLRYLIRSFMIVR